MVQRVAQIGSQGVASIVRFHQPSHTHRQGGFLDQFDMSRVDVAQAPPLRLPSKTSPVSHRSRTRCRCSETYGSIANRFNRGGLS